MCFELESLFGKEKPIKMAGAFMMRSFHQSVQIWQWDIEIWAVVLLAMISILTELVKSWRNAPQETHKRLGG
jgi:hypothetical protein